ncbi:Retroviral aspartyl protease [Corchorus olitorius]|uniref:Retroviral aspartyl protease n=1 Tax=Corchorus olitorius TaxID=93759 RepID=A0A1R3HGQ6_9ROSI|nr:Retroviral aspartyl protease [Corchorus olitorius]
MALFTSSFQPPPPPPAETKPSDFQVSLYALHGLGSHSCLKLTGVIKAHAFTVLIDSGSTHNLVQPRVVQHLGLPIELAPPLSSRVGNGAILQCPGMVSGLKMDLQGVVFQLDLFLLDIHGADVVLGIQWLSQLGPILVDFSLLLMSFSLNGQWITLQGQPNSTPKDATIRHITHLAQSKVLHRLSCFPWCLDTLLLKPIPNNQ